MMQCFYDSVLGPSVEMTNQVQVLTCICGFLIHSNSLGSAWFQCHLGVQEWYITFWSCVLYCEFNGLVYAVNVSKEGLLVFCLLYYEVVVPHTFSIT